jgi:hypothetical protein
MFLFGNRILARATKANLFGCALAGGLIASTALSKHSSVINLDDKIKESSNGINVDKSVDPLPTSINLSTSYELLGYGTRSVTFLSFRVYALGLYVASKDLYKIPTVLDSNFLSKAFIDTDSSKSHQDNVSSALKDAEKSKVLISNLLDSDIRLAARITPVRNTDFNHLKDGLIKSILASKVKDETLEQGLSELRGALQRKGSVPKNHNLIIERLEDGSLQFYYENPAKGERSALGNVKTPIVSKLLFLQYLSGGLSPSARETSIEKISQLV